MKKEETKPFQFEDNYDILKANNNVRDLILYQIIKKDLSYKDICEEAKRFGFIMTESALSKYLKHRVQAKGSLRHDHIVFLCKRLGIALAIDTYVLPDNERMRVENVRDWIKNFKQSKIFYETEGCKMDRKDTYPETFGK